MSRRVSRNKEKEGIAEIGLVCCNCGSTYDIQWHHIIPLAMGGHDITSNKCCLCYTCHSLIHFGESKNISHSELTKRGIRVAKMQGKQIGAVPGKKLNVKKSAPAKEIIRKHCKSFGGTLSDKECMQLAHVASNTYYKYKKEIKSSNT